MSTLMHASNQWANRPADERFADLHSLHDAVTRYREMTVEARDVNLRALRITSGTFADDLGQTVEEPVIVGPSGTPARFSHFSFGQIARRVHAPANYLRSLPTDLVVQNLNHGIERYDGEEDNENLLFAQNGGLRLRASTSMKYTRIWNTDITSRLIRLTQDNPEWQPAPAAFDGSRGLYASDRDIFCFMVDNDRRIFEAAPGGGLSRGFFVWNSEVGDKSFGFMTFFYNYICGNHIVWGASGVAEIRIPHIGNADDRAFKKLAVELRKYATASDSDDEAKIERAMRFELGASKEEVLDAVFKLGVTRKVADQAYDAAEAHTDWYGSPRSVWGMVNGITHIAAREVQNADERVALDRTAGKVMQIAF